MKDDQKNFLLFAVIAALLLFAWPAVMHWFFPQQQQAPSTQPKAIPNSADSPAALRDRAVVLAESPRVAIETPSLKG